MGGLWKKMPFAFWAMLTGVLSICGVPGFSGFFSKDQVIYGALLHGHPWLYAAGVITAASRRITCSDCSSSRSWASIAASSTPIISTCPAGS